MKRKDGLHPRRGVLAFRYKVEGEWREKSTGERDRAAAKEFKSAWEQRIATQTLPTDKSKWTIEQACTAWVTQHAVRVTPKGARNEQSYLRQLIRVLGPVAQRKLRAVTLDDLRNYQAKRSAEKIAGRTINLELKPLLAVLREANCTAALRNYQRLREPESEVGKAISEVDLARLQTVAASNPIWTVPYCASLLAASTGMRGCEIKKLRMGYVDLKNRRIRVSRKGTKTAKGQRFVELNVQALAAVRRLYQRAQALGAREDDHFLLPADLSRHTRATDPLKGQHGYDPTRHQGSWSTAWRTLRKLAGLSLRFHDLRHLFVTRMAELGTPLAVTQATVGHMGEEITRHYTHISENAQRAAVEKLDAIRKTPEFVDSFVDIFVDKTETAEMENAKPLN